MDRLFNNVWILRAIAVAMALALWAEAVPNSITVGYRNVSGVPVEVVDVPAGDVATPDVSTVTVVYRAPSSMPPLGSTQFTAEVSARGALRGRVTLPVAIHGPWGTQTVGIHPGRLVVRILPKATIPGVSHA